MNADDLDNRTLEAYVSLVLGHYVLGQAHVSSDPETGSPWFTGDTEARNGFIPTQWAYIQINKTRGCDCSLMRELARECPSFRKEDEYNHYGHHWQCTQAVPHWTDGEHAQFLMNEFMVDGCSIRRENDIFYFTTENGVTSCDTSVSKAICLAVVNDKCSNLITPVYQGKIPSSDEIEEEEDND